SSTKWSSLSASGPRRGASLGVGRAAYHAATCMQAAIFRQPHQPLTIEAVTIDQPTDREVLVRTVASGVCHSDLHLVDGDGRFPLGDPYVLGHEGAGIVEAIGPDVTYVKAG